MRVLTAAIALLIATSSDATVYYRDADGDGYGNPAVQVEADTAPAGYVAQAGDCNDDSASMRPGMSDICNGRDDDCDGRIDNAPIGTLCPHNEDCQDAVCSNGVCSVTNVSQGTVSCGTGPCSVTVLRCVNGKSNVCTPNAGAAKPEICNDQDDDCDYTVDEGLPSSPETCNGVDDDCNGRIDDITADMVSAACTVPTLVAMGPSLPTISRTLTLYPSADIDWFEVRGSESTNDICEADFYTISVELTVPQGAGSYQLCTTESCATAPTCTTVAAGSSFSTNQTFQGSCSVRDVFRLYARVSPGASPGWSCHTYLLTTKFAAIPRLRLR